MVWALIIGISLHIFAYFLYKIGSEVLEFENAFLYGCGVFLVLFIVSAIGLKILLPNPGTAEIASIPKAWMATAFAAE